MKISYDYRKIRKILEENGYFYDRNTGGTHEIFVNSETHKHITIYKKIKHVICLRLIKENKLKLKDEKVK